jgi:hypothetical protein
MSVSSEVQRTLVKSPPELWAELSDPDALTRHLGELGEIRITSVEPEAKVAWEAEDASGVVELEPSGWGTRVTLSVTRNPPATDGPSEPEPVAAVESKPAAEVEPATEPEPEPLAEPASEPVAIVDPHPDPIALEPMPNDPIAEPEPRRGLFARLFRRRGARPIAVVEADPEPEVVALAAPEPIYPARPLTPAVDLASELESVEAQMAEETTELLTGVLDRLGAAHHRPFSRG